MNLGENIYKYRTQKGMSQGDLADTLEVSRQSVSKWENNSAVPELEKLMKMAQIFGITLDELVSGEDKQQTTPPSPVSAPTPAVKAGLSTQQILGIILLSLGGLLSIIFLLVGIFKENQYGEDMLAAFLIIGLPVILIGMICLLVKKHTLLICGWTLYLPLLFFMISWNMSAIAGTRISILCMIALAFAAALCFGTLVQLWSRKNQASMTAKILLTLLIIGVMWLSLTPFLPVSTLDSVTSEETHNVPASVVPD